MKILAFGDIHFHHTHRFSHITPDGFTVRELEHLQCADTILQYCQEENVDRIVFLGDLYSVVGDSLSGQTQTAVCEFIDKLRSKYPLDLLVGNHDFCAHINTQCIHKLAPFKYWSNVTVYDQPTLVDNFIYMPYCNSDEFAETFLENIKDKENKIVFSHLELKGITFANGIQTSHGVNIPLLAKFKMALQGHYHTGGQAANNVQIAGSTQRLSFKDLGKSRNNILIYDTETNKVKRKSFTCPDWLTFTDENISDILTLDSNNYVKLDISTDFLITPEIKEKLNTFKGTDIHIDIKRLTINKQVDDTIQTENEAEVITQFINKTDNSDEYKQELIAEGVRLLDRVKNT